MHRWLSPATVDGDGRPDSIPGLYDRLDPQPGVVEHQRRSPGFGSRSPANDHVIAMTDRRSAEFEDGDPLSAPVVLGEWVRLVWEQRYEVTALDQPDYLKRLAALPRTVEAMCLWLDRQLDWVSRQEVVADMQDEMRELHRQLRSATGNGGQPPVGWCIAIVDGAECGEPIFMPRDLPPRAPDEPIRTLPTLECPRCGSQYDGRRVILLKLAASARAA